MGDNDPALLALANEITLAGQRLSALEERLGGVEAGVDAVREVVDELTGDGDRQRRQRGWVWWDLDGEGAAAAWQELVAWVRRLVAAHPDFAHKLGPCWYRHPAVIHILAALFDAWLGAYKSDTSSSVARVDYEIHWLPDGMNRIDKISGQCSGKDHDPGRLLSDDAVLSAYIEADTARRSASGIRS